MASRKAKRTTSKRRTHATRRSKFVTPAGVGPGFQRLVALMARLRAPGGCPWDREQTHATLRSYLLEEAYEVLDALDSADDAKFAEELGDLLLQVLFHAQIAQEEDRFDITDVISEIYEKMIRRHPHVFGDKRAKDAAEVLRNWEIIKNEERRAKLAHKPAVRRNLAVSSYTISSTAASESLLDGVPRTLPALLEAYQLTRKAARIGFDWPDIHGIFEKLQEETLELQEVLAQHLAAGFQTGKPRVQSASASNVSPDLRGMAFSSSFLSQRIEGELGDILFVAVNLARFLDLDPEIALKKTCAKFSHRFREMERIAREQGTTLAQIPRPQLESLWDQAKQSEQSALAQGVSE